MYQVVFIWFIITQINLNFLVIRPQSDIYILKFIGFFVRYHTHPYFSCFKVLKVLV